MKTIEALKQSALTGMLLCSLQGFGQVPGNWQWRNPLPSGNPIAPPQLLYGIVFANNQFAAVGGDGVVALSRNGTNWIQAPTATTNQLAGIIYTNSAYVAVGAAGTVETSQDGTNWVLQDSDTTNDLTAVAYANGRYVATGPSAVITSTNAVNWSSTVSGLSGATGIASGSQGFAAVNQGTAGSGGAPVPYQSTDGVIWTASYISVPGPGPCSSPTLTSAGGLYIISEALVAEDFPSDSLSDYIFTSSNGLAWTQYFVWSTQEAATVNPQPPGFLISGNGLLITVWSFPPQLGGPSGSYLYYSPDLFTWSNAVIPYIYTGSNAGGTFYPELFAGAYGNGQFVLLGTGTFLTNASALEVLTSNDGVNWTNQPQAPPLRTGPTSALTSIASGNGVYVATSGSSVILSSDDLSYTNVSESPGLSAVTFSSGTFTGVGPDGAIYQSSDGVSWTKCNSPETQNLNAVASGGGEIVAVGANGAIQTATTGTVWTNRTSGTSLALEGVAQSNGLYVAVGQEGTVLTSPDAIDWTGQFSGVLNNLTSVTAGSAGFVAAGTGGVILLSQDGITWTWENSGTTNTLNAVCFGNGYYLAVGDGSVVLTSVDGQTWSTLNVGLMDGQNLYGCSSLNDRFDVVGDGGTILESGDVAPLLDLQLRRISGANIFTIFDAAQQSYRLQSTTNLAASQWTDVLTNSAPSPINLWTNTNLSARAVYYRIISP
jgi:hypothetical protein